MNKKTYSIYYTAAQLSRLLNVNKANVFYWTKEGCLKDIVNKNYNMVSFDIIEALELLLKTKYKFNRDAAEKELRELKKITPKGITILMKNGDLIPLKFAAS